MEDGAPCAKPLYVDGRVWVRQPGELFYHHLTEDEPIQLHASLYTGYNGTLDFAPGPGLAVRMIPDTAVTVDTLPASQPPTPAAPEAAQVDLKKGTVFSRAGPARRSADQLPGPDAAGRGGRARHHVFHHDQRRPIRGRHAPRHRAIRDARSPEIGASPRARASRSAPARAAGSPWAEPGR